MQVWGPFLPLSSITSPQTWSLVAGSGVFCCIIYWHSLDMLCHEHCFHQSCQQSPLPIPHYPFLSPKQQLPPFSLQYCLVPFHLHHALILSSMASDIAGSISRLSSHLTADYLSSSGWLQTDTNLRSKTLPSCLWKIATKKTPNQIFPPQKKSHRTFLAW